MAATYLQARLSSDALAGQQELTGQDFEDFQKVSNPENKH
jgi:hypothetical protein